MPVDEDAVRRALAAMSGGGGGGGAAAPPPAAPRVVGASPAALDAAAVAAALQQVQQRGRDEIIALKESLLADPGQLAQIAMQNPPMAAAIRDPNPEKFIEMIHENDRRKRERDAEKMEFMRRVAANPFDAEAQSKIEEIIREENVAANYEAAMEHNPEVFGSVTMLYVDSVVNGVPMKAFIDCGAQMTVMTVQTAERCGIMRLVDRRFAGMAKGVGSAPIVGRVHSCDLRIGNSTFPCSFTVMEQGGHDFLLGLDMLKRFQAVVDLRSNTLSIGDEVVPFLGEGDVPMDQRVGAGAEDDDAAMDEDKVMEQSRREAEEADLARAAAASTEAGGERPQTPPPPISAGAAASSGPAAPSVNEAAVSNLTQMGFSREQALGALDACNGDADMAAAMLLGD
jgi:DNA damage-inducible protein 1